MPPNCWESWRRHPRSRAERTPGLSRALQSPEPSVCWAASSTISCSSSCTASGEDPRRRASTCRAPALSPLNSTSHPGDSGKNRNPRNNTAEGNPASPSMYRQPWSVSATANPQQTRLAITCPSTRKMLFTVFTIPRVRAGETSARYNGTVWLKQPTASPISTRPKVSIHTLSATPITTAPAVHTTAPQRMTPRRPMRAFSTPEARAETMAAATVEETISSCSPLDRAEPRPRPPLGLLICNMAPLTTPVSYPNRKPPRAANKVSTMMNPLPAAASGLAVWSCVQ
mmetsp:Transcript_30105/g.77600  ORF Transcript_30105/g.77600 Transcript_30105/m.77600 type:complete len:285 (-) Transcript_30105:64-918(-)